MPDKKGRGIHHRPNGKWWSKVRNYLKFYSIALFRHFQVFIFNFRNRFVRLRIKNEGSLREMRIWSILLIKAILRLWIYKALYGKSYLGSKTTMTTGEWSCLISFAWASQSCSERRGSENSKMKIYVSSGIRTNATPLHDMLISALDRRTTLVTYQVEYVSSYSILIYE